MNTTNFIKTMKDFFNDYFKTLNDNNLYNEAEKIRFELDEYIREIEKDLINHPYCHDDKEDFIKYFKNKVIPYIFNQVEEVGNIYIETKTYHYINILIKQYLKTTIEEDEKIEIIENKIKELEEEKSGFIAEDERLEDIKYSLKMDLIYILNSVDLDVHGCEGIKDIVDQIEKIIDKKRAVINHIYKISNQINEILRGE